MDNSWRVRRKKTIVAILILLVLAFVFYKSYPRLFPKPTCFDGKQNNLEDGVDCGGGCQLICTTAILPLEVESTRAVETEKDLYDIVAIIKNRNIDKEPSDGFMSYHFSIYDKSGTLIKSIDTNSPLLVGQSFPVIIQNIPLTLADAGNSISKVTVDILPNNNNWLKVDQVYTKNFLQVKNINYEQDVNNITQLTITLENITQANFRNIPVRVTLKDKLGNIIAVNETILKNIDGEGDADAVYTWRVPLKEANPNISVYTMITPFSDFR